MTKAKIWLGALQTCSPPKFSLDCPQKKKKMTTPKMWLQNIIEAKIWLGAFQTCSLPKFSLGCQRKKMSPSWKYNYKIWLEVLQTCSMSFPKKYFDITNNRILYAHDVQGHNMTSSHICSHIFSKLLASKNMTMTSH